MSTRKPYVVAAVLCAALSAQPAFAISPETAAAISGETSEIVRVALILTLMAFIPALLIAMTSFMRIIIVLAMIRHGIGMPETPPNMVLISLAIFLTSFAMMPTFEAMN